MKTKHQKKKQKGIAERKTETKRKRDVPYKSIGLGILLWLLVTWMFFGRGIVPKVVYQEGQIIPATVEAQVGFECENQPSTALAREKAANAVPLTFVMNSAPRTSATQKIQAVFDRLIQVAEAPEEEKSIKIASLADLLLGSDIQAVDFAKAFSETNAIAGLRDELAGRVKTVMDAGIMSNETREAFADMDRNRSLNVVSDPGLGPRTTELGSISSEQQALEQIVSTLSPVPNRELVNKLLSFVIKANLVYDKAATEKQQQEAAAAVKPIMQTYPEGTILVRSGDRADPQNLLVLKKHIEKLQQSRDALEQFLDILGNAFLLLAGLAVTTIMLRFGNKGLVRQVDKLLLLIILSLLTLGSASLLTYLADQHALLPPSLIQFFVPQALAILLAGILLGGSAAICLGFWTSYATAMLLDHSFSTFILGILVTITAASTARNIHRRASLFQAALWICTAKVVFVLITAMMNQLLLSGIASQLGAAIASGVLSAVLALLLVPLFEKTFKITTDITLLELSDMGHPLLQKLAMQAPGTYHHSLMVATLAQNAAEAIGANSLLVRVCAYYHDIGKLAKPEFFTENIQHKENPHDELSPHMSALVISSHVKEGLALARRHKLPQPVLDAIEQHHGNGLIAFFYHKAKQQAGDGGSMADLINDSDFRYGGAPAVSKEMAILSLADASEAASRSIEKPTPQKISNMLDDVFAAKIRDGQLDYANLTMAEIKVVKQSFIFSLSNMLHGRIPYPKDHENKNPKPPEKPSDPNPQPQKAD